MTRLFDETPAPYRVRFLDAAVRQLDGLDGVARDRLNRTLVQLADLAAFAMAYSVPVDPVERLVADTGGFSIRYHVDDVGRVLAVYEITRA